MRKTKCVVSGALALVLAACSGGNPAEQADPSADVAQATDDDASSTAPAAAAEVETGTDAPAVTTVAGGLQDKDGNSIAIVPFDIEQVPLSTAALGELPFFSLPDGYDTINRPHVRTYARFPFRLGDGLHWVEGASWNAGISVARDRRREKEYSSREIQRNFEQVFEQAGAKQVFDGPLQRKLYYGPQLEDEIGGGFINSVNRDENTPTRVYVIRQADRNIWMQLSLDSNTATLTVVEEKPFQATARWSAEFPHLSLPAEYKQRNRPNSRDFDMFPFWNGSRFEEVEGKTYAIAFGKAGDGYSMHEVRRNLAAMMAEVGGTRVFAGRIPKDASDARDETVRQNYSTAAGFSWHDYEAEVWRANLPDGREIWVHAKLDYMSAGWVVAERQGFVQSAALLPADVLKQQLDADGRVAIQVNFAVDKAEILPDSQPQIDQVLTLLREDPSLRLSIDGHTDATGDAAHNQRLSEARAKSVVAALTGQGIEASRLEAKGHGQSQPVADNDTDEGRTKNRRVELVRLG